MKTLGAIVVLVMASFFTVQALAATDGGKPAADSKVVAKPAPVKPAVTPALATQPAPVIDPAKTVQDIFTAAKAKEWRVLIGLVLTLLIWIYRRFISDFVANKIGKFAPLVVVGISFLSSIAVELIKSPFNWTSFLVGGLLTSAAAITFWSTLAKFVLPTKKEQ